MGTIPSEGVVVTADIVGGDDSIQLLTTQAMLNDRSDSGRINLFVASSEIEGESDWAMLRLRIEGENMDPHARYVLVQASR